MAVAGKRDAERYAAARWGKGSRAVIATKAAISGLNTQAGAGEQIVSDEGASAEFFDMVRAQSIIGRLPLRRVPFLTRTLSMDEGPQVAWRDEGGAYRTSPMKLTSQQRLEPFDIGSMVVLSNEQLEDKSFDTEVMVRDQIAKSLATAIDSAFIDPSNAGTAGVKPAAVTNGAEGDDSPLEALFDWGDLFTGDVSNAYIIMNPFQAARLNGAARPDIGVRGGSWAGFPVITSTGCPEGIFVLIDPDQIALAAGGVDIRTSQEAAVEMQDSSSMKSATTVTAATLTSLFQTNSTAILGSMNANWRLMMPGAVLVFSAQNYGLSGGV